MFSFCSNARNCWGCRGDGPKPQFRPRLLARLDAGGDQDLQRLRLLERIDRVVADRDEFEAGLVHADANHVVERVLDPRLERNQPLLRRLVREY
jgi:hypothetical protein